MISGYTSSQPCARYLDHSLMCHNYWSNSKFFDQPIISEGSSQQQPGGAPGRPAAGEGHGRSAPAAPPGVWEAACWCPTQISL